MRTCRGIPTFVPNLFDEQGLLRQHVVIFVDHAYDITYRHGLDVDSSGKRLAFGSTTGSLWITEDGGDQWTCLSTHLPPIYAVRFAAEAA
jgi:hypothetical protein